MSRKTGRNATPPHRPNPLANWMRPRIDAQDDAMSETITEMADSLDSRDLDDVVASTPTMEENGTSRRRSQYHKQTCHLSCINRWPRLLVTLRMQQLWSPTSPKMCETVAASSVIVVDKYMASRQRAEKMACPVTHARLASITVSGCMPVLNAAAVSARNVML